MRFGVFLTLDYHPEAHPDKAAFLRDLLDLSAFCDDLGLDVWVAEHHFSDYGVAPALTPLLAAIAQRTRRVRLGSAVAVLPLHHPLRLAEDMAFVDAVSGGRLDFGVGSGYLAHEFGGFGVAPEEKRARFDESLDIIRTAWQGKPLHYEGRFWQVAGARLNLLPVQRPHPPIWVGTTRPDPAPYVGAAGHRALCVPYLMLKEWADLDRLVFGYREGRARGGQVGSGTVGVACHVYVGEQPLNARGLAQPEGDGEYGEARRALHRYFVTRRVPGARYDGGLPPDDFLWVGSPEQVAASVARAEAAGISQVLLLCSFGGLRSERVRGSLERFSRQVAPRFRTKTPVADPIPAPPLHPAPGS